MCGLYMCLRLDSIPCSPDQEAINRYVVLVYFFKIRFKELALLKTKVHTAHAHYADKWFGVKHGPQPHCGLRNHIAG